MSNPIYKTIDDAGGSTLNTAVMTGATAATSVKLCTGANVRIAGISEAVAVQNASLPVFLGGNTHPVVVNAASPNIAVDDICVVHGVTGRFKKATLTSTGTSADGSTSALSFVTASMADGRANEVSIDFVLPATSQAASTIAVTGKGITIWLKNTTGTISETANGIKTLMNIASAIALIPQANITSGGTGVVTAQHIAFTGADNISTGYAVKALQAATTDGATIGAMVPVLL